jgi:hypothetical protein
MERFNLKYLNDMEVKENYMSKSQIGLEALKTYMRIGISIGLGKLLGTI